MFHFVFKANNSKFWLHFLFFVLIKFGCLKKKSYEYIGLERHFFSGIVLPILFKYYKKKY